MLTQSSKRLAATVLSLAAAGFSGLVAAQDAAAPAEPTESQKLAAELLASMSNYLAGLPGYRVRLVSSYDAVQDDGQKIEFNEIRQLALSRPNLMRAEQRMSDGATDLLLFDGKDITIYDSETGVYAQAPQPGSVDDAVVYFVRDLGMRLPLAAMLSTRLPEELERRVKSIEYVEYTDILGFGAHHIAARTSTIDFQVWIADGERPLPVRIVLTYKNDPGAPQFRAQFLDWDEKTSVDPAIFRFDPPADAQKILFAVQGPAETTGSKP